MADNTTKNIEPTKGEKEKIPEEISANKLQRTKSYQGIGANRDSVAEVIIGLSEQEMNEFIPTDNKATKEKIIPVDKKAKDGSIVGSSSSEDETSEESASEEEEEEVNERSRPLYFLVNVVLIHRNGTLELQPFTVYAGATKHTIAASWLKLTSRSDVRREWALYAYKTYIRTSPFCFNPSPGACDTNVQVLLKSGQFLGVEAAMDTVELLRKDLAPRANKRYLTLRFTITTEWIVDHSSVWRRTIERFANIQARSPQMALNDDFREVKSDRWSITHEQDCVRQYEQRRRPRENRFKDIMRVEERKQDRNYENEAHDPAQTYDPKRTREDARYKIQEIKSQDNKRVKTDYYNNEMYYDKKTNNQLNYSDSGAMRDERKPSTVTVTISRREQKKILNQPKTATTGLDNQTSQALDLSKTSTHHEKKGQVTKPYNNIKNNRVQFKTTSNSTPTQAPQTVSQSILIPMREQHNLPPSANANWVVGPVTATIPTTPYIPPQISVETCPNPRASRVSVNYNNSRMEYNNNIPSAGYAPPQENNNTYNYNTGMRYPTNDGKQATTPIQGYRQGIIDAQNRLLQEAHVEGIHPSHMRLCNYVDESTTGLARHLGIDILSDCLKFDQSHL